MPANNNATDEVKRFKKENKKLTDENLELKKQIEEHKHEIKELKQKNREEKYFCLTETKSYVLGFAIKIVCYVQWFGFAPRYWKKRIFVDNNWKK